MPRHLLNSLHPFRAVVTLLALLAAGLGPVRAQVFGFTPTLLEIDASHNLVTETTMVNSTTTPARFDVVAVLWHIVDGKEVLDETRDLIVNPPSFTIKPGGTQLIRIGVRKKPGATELTYRVLVQQVPIEGVELPKIGAGTVGKDSTAGMNIALTFSLPVYVTPPGAVSKLAFTATTSGKDVSLLLQNSGNRRTIMRNVQFVRGSVTLGTKVLPLLAGSTITLALPGLGGEAGPLTMKYEAEDGRVLEQTLALP
ncbi:molecular chaperone [Deinococcus sonorensis]|uniref:Fimbria/pilus periplasmic chaperone n=2 Tax=Deinococcus sonorensis TaxID=309891 RepID=A0AAU7UBV2_9DEIO